MMNQPNNTSPGDYLVNPLGSTVFLSPGPFNDWGSDGKQPFAIEVDAKPLESLVHDARNGIRVYEFMTLSRPGEIYSYLRVKTVEVSRRVETATQHLKSSRESEREWGAGYIPLERFDDLFHWDGDDTRPEAECWLTFRTERYWKDVAIQLLEWTKAQQALLRADPNPLIVRELGFIDQHRHRRDFLPTVDRRCLAQPVILQKELCKSILPEVVLEAVAELITQDDIRSVTAPIVDFKLWQILCSEQLRRADETGVAPEVAFPLSGTEGSLGSIPYEDWGADVHLPYIGVRMADFFIKPWLGYAKPNLDASDGHLVWIFGSRGDVLLGHTCSYVLTQDDFGELKCATRREIGEGWFLYHSSEPHVRQPENATQ